MVSCFYHIMRMGEKQLINAEFVRCKAVFCAAELRMKGKKGLFQCDSPFLNIEELNLYKKF